MSPEPSRVHSSPNPWDGKMVRREQAANPLESRGGFGKPVGLWYGFDGSWLDWCRGEEFGTWNHHYRLDVNTSNILRVDSIPAFTDEFQGAEPYPGAMMGVIDWVKVARKYSGVEIPVYHYGFRFSADMRFSWYYGWDCASGVIWEPSALLGVEPIDAPESRDDEP